MNTESAELIKENKKFQVGDEVFRSKDDLKAKIIKIFPEKGTAILKDDEGKEYGSDLKDLLLYTEDPSTEHLIDAIVNNPPDINKTNVAA